MTQQAEASILIVDDEPVVCRSCERLLAPDGYQVSSAHSSAEALRILEQCRYDLVLLDLRLARSRRTDPAAHLPEASSPEMEVIVVTGHASIENAVESIQLGAIRVPPEAPRTKPSPIRRERGPGPQARQFPKRRC